MTQYGDLCASERDVLWALGSGEPLSGQDVKDIVQSRRDINNQSLYGALDKLAEKGLVDKYHRAIDGRTNGYKTTKKGRQALRERGTWTVDRIPTDN